MANAEPIENSVLPKDLSAARARGDNSSGQYELEQPHDQYDPVDLAALDSFPASDPPSWLGITVGTPGDCEHTPEKSQPHHDLDHAHGRAPRRAAERQPQLV